MRRLVVDCQILQTAAFDRGMGKYTLSLLRALGKDPDFNKQYSAVSFLLNKNLNIQKDRIAAINNVIPGAELLIEDLPYDSDVETEKKYFNAKEKVTELVAEIIKKGDEVSYLIAAPFFVSFPAVFPTQQSVSKFTIVYDLIPYKIWFKQRIFPDELYFKHFETLLQADKLFTISQAVADDLHDLLWISQDKTVTIDGGPFDQPVATQHASIPVKHPYVIFVSAPIVHKNNENAIRGFENFNKKHDYKYKLVITSSFDEVTQEKLRKLSQDLIFTGNISDEELVTYRKSASALLFASLAEGLGMPILEAVIDGIPVACSSIPVHREISKDGLYFFDPNSIAEISSALESAVTREGWQHKLKSYPDIKRKYTWQRSAKIMAGALGLRLHSKLEKKSVVIISPNSRGGSAEGRLAELIYSALEGTYKVYWRNIGNVQQPKGPGYLEIIAKKPSKKADYALIFGHSKEDLSSLAERQIVIDVHKNRFSLFRKNRQDDKFRIFAKKYMFDKSLGFSDWQFKMDAAVEIPEAILKSVKDKIGH